MFYRFDPSGTDGEGDVSMREKDMTLKIARILETAYAGYLWEVTVDLHGKNKAATIALPVLTPPNYKFVIPGRFLCTVNDMRLNVLRAAGEILERYNVPRSGMRFGLTEFLEARQKSNIANLRNRAQVPA